MKKTIEIYGRRVDLYSSDGGGTWSSNPQSSIVADGEREEMLRWELQRRFARIDARKSLKLSPSGRR